MRQRVSAMVRGLRDPGKTATCSIVRGPSPKSRLIFEFIPCAGDQFFLHSYLHKVLIEGFQGVVERKFCPKVEKKRYEVKQLRQDFQVAATDIPAVLALLPW